MKCLDLRVSVVISRYLLSSPLSNQPAVVQTSAKYHMKQLVRCSLACTSTSSDRVGNPLLLCLREGEREAFWRSLLFLPSILPSFLPSFPIMGDRTCLKGRKEREGSEDGWIKEREGTNTAPSCCFSPVEN